MRSSGLQDRLGHWVALRSPSKQEIFTFKLGEDKILGIIAASITAPENIDSILSSIALRKQRREHVVATPPTVEQGEELLLVSFDGSTRLKRGGGACSAFVWKLPGSWSQQNRIPPGHHGKRGGYHGSNVVVRLTVQSGKG